MHIFFSVGEPSGDLHGANLIRELKRQRPDCRFVGYGGPRMANMGCELHEDLTKLAVMWFLRVLLNIHTFLGLLFKADRYFRDERPDAVILIDYPGFNWWIARRAKARGIPVFYYGTPQMWAWAGWRVKKMRRFVDHVLCKLPFEVPWYRERNCNATYVGHPYFDQMAQQQLDEAFVQQQQARHGRLVTILPGSRTQEIKLNLHWFLKAADVVRQQVPNVRFAIASFNEKQAVMARELVGSCAVPIEVFVGKTPELIHLATCCMACSGSVSLELMHHEKPTVVLYWISRTAMRVQRYFRTVKYITLVNLLAVKQIFCNDGSVYDPDAAAAEPIPFPEYLTSVDKSAAVAGRVVRWLTNEPERQRCVQQLRNLKAQFGHPGASRSAADYILKALSSVLSDVSENASHQRRSAA